LSATSARILAYQSLTAKISTRLPLKIIQVARTGKTALAAIVDTFPDWGVAEDRRNEV
jgi:hypothetical protein